MTGVEMLEKLGYIADNGSKHIFKDYSHGDGDCAYVHFISTFKMVEIGYFDAYGGKGEVPIRVDYKLLEAVMQHMKDMGWIK